jgi:hypothetical protein
MLPIIEDLRSDRFVSSEAIARQLNKRGVATAKKGRWYASTVKNVLERLKDVMDTKPWQD